MSGLRVDGDYLVMEHSEKPQKWSPSELLAGLRWARSQHTSAQKVSDLEKRFSVFKEELRELHTALHGCLAGESRMNSRDSKLLLDYLGVEIQDTPARREVVKRAKK